MVKVVSEADQIPPVLPRDGAVLVESASFRKWLAFDCPCGSGHRVLLNLDPGRWPSWRVNGLSPLTISPSVDETTTRRRCHYLIRRGHVIWMRGWDDN